MKVKDLSWILEDHSFDGLPLDRVQSAYSQIEEGVEYLEEAFDSFEPSTTKAQPMRRARYKPLLNDLANRCESLSNDLLIIKDIAERLGNSI